MFLSLDKKTQIVLLVAGLLLAEPAAAGCGGGGGGDSGAGPGGPPPPPPVKRAETLIGYGVVNHWNLVDPKAFADLLYSNGLTLTEIEYTDIDPDGCGGVPAASPIAEAVEFVGAMRSRGITTFANVGNWNNCSFRKQSDAWFRARVDELVSQVGADQVILSAVSEPGAKPKDDRKTRGWTQYAGDHFPGPLALPSIGVSEPYFKGIGYEYIDSHFCRSESLLATLKKGRANVLPNTDCRPLVASSLSMAEVAKFTRAAIDGHSNLLIYGYLDASPRVDLIEAMGAEVQK